MESTLKVPDFWLRFMWACMCVCAYVGSQVCMFSSTCVKGGRTGGRDREGEVLGETRAKYLGVVERLTDRRPT